MLSWLMLSLGLLVGDGTRAAPVGVVLSVKGRVTAERGGAKIALENADLLVSGDRLSAAPKGEAVLFFFKDARRQRLKEGTQATASEKGCDPPAAVEEVKAGNPPPPASLKGLQNHSRAVHANGGRSAVGVLHGSRAAVGVLRGDRNSSVAITPMMDARVLSDHPTFSWPALSGADSYFVELFSVADDSRPLWRVTTHEPRLPYPEEESVLKRGLTYRWRVTAKRKNEIEEIVGGSFFLLTEARVRELGRLRTLAASSDAGDWLLAAMTYEAARVYDKALPLYQRLADAAPQAANYQEALANYYQRAGQTDKAHEAENRARELRRTETK